MPRSFELLSWLRIAKVVLVAAFAIVAMLAGPEVRAGIVAPKGVHAMAHAGEWAPEASELESPGPARMGQAPVRLRQAPERKTVAAAPAAALNGAAFALAVIARARERDEPPAAPSSRPTTPRQARAPPTSFV